MERRSLVDGPQTGSRLRCLERIRCGQSTLVLLGFRRREEKRFSLADPVIGRISRWTSPRFVGPGLGEVPLPQGEPSENSSGLSGLRIGIEVQSVRAHSTIVGGGESPSRGTALLVTVLNPHGPRREGFRRDHVDKVANTLPAPSPPQWSPH